MAAELEILVKMKDEATKQMNSLSKNLEKQQKVFRNVGLAAAGAGLAVAGGLIAVGKSAADFDQAMREVNTMIGMTGERFEELKTQVQVVSSEVGKSSTELSGALYQIVSAGIDSADAIGVLEVAAKAAVAGVTDVETAADGLTTVLNAFKISSKDAGKVADVMFTVVKRGKTTFEELSASLFQVSPMAASAGIEFEEVAGALATITKQGVPTNVATTNLRAAILSIIKPTQDMKTALDAMGYASGEALIDELGLAGAVSKLREQAGGSLEELGKMIGSVEGLQAVLTLTGENAATFADDLKATSEDAAGAVEKAYNEMNEGVSRQFEILMNDIKISGEKIGVTLLPIFKNIIDKLVPIIEKLQEWVEANPKLIEQLLKLSGILIGAGGILVAFSLIVKAIMAINAALIIMHALSGPAGWIALVAGLAIAGGAIYGINKLIKEMSPTIEGAGPPDPGIIYRLKDWLAGIGVGEWKQTSSAPSPMSGPTNINVNVEGSIRSDRDLAEVIRRELTDTKSRNYSLGLG